MSPPTHRPAVQCPQCGAPLPVRSPATVLAICEYCRTAAYWDEERILSAGEQAALTEGFTRLYRGARGELEGTRFEVLGRIRYRSPLAIWDEWFLEMHDGERTAWLTEDDHELALQTRRDDDLSWLVGLQPGQRFQVDQTRYEVDEIGVAECIGVEGQLPERVLTGEKYRFLDASSLDGAFALGVELDDEPPSVFIGRWLEHEDLRLDDEGDEW